MSKERAPALFTVMMGVVLSLCKRTDLRRKAVSQRQDRVEAQAESKGGCRS